MVLKREDLPEIWKEVMISTEIDEIFCIFFNLSQASRVYKAGRYEKVHETKTGGYDICGTKRKPMKPLSCSRWQGSRMHMKFW